MNLKLEQILNEANNISALQEVKLPVKVSYRIKRLVDKLTPILKNYNEKRNELVEEFGEEDPKTKNFKVKKENEKEFFAKVEELTQVEENIDFTPIKIEEINNLNLEPKLLISWIFEE